MSEKAHPRSAAGVLVLLSTAIIAFPFASAAYAQVGQVVDAVGDAVSDTTGQVGDTVGEVGGTVGDAVGDTGGAGGDAVEEAGSEAGDAVGGDAGETVKDTTDGVGQTVKDTTGQVGNTIGGISEEVGETTGEGGGTVGTVVKKIGGEVGDGVDELLDDPLPGSGSAFPDLSPFGAVTPSFFGAGSNSAGERTLSLGNLFGEANRIDDLNLSTGDLVGTAPDVPDPVGFEGFLGDVTEAARQFAFPLALTVLVIAYMLVQGHFDRRDPKLAIAIVDSEDDLLSFS
jgi:hypothetical protein